jgi:hypothetical protein
MATARRRMPTRRGDNPSKVLVIFLVFFILLSIGLGAGTYFGFAGQKDLDDKAKTANKKADEALKERDYALFRAREATAMLAGQGGANTEKDEELRVADRDEFLKEGGKYGSVTDKAKVQEMMKTAEKDLGFDANSRRYGTGYMPRVAKLNAKVAELETQNKNLLDAKKATDDLYNTLRASFLGDFNKAKKEIAAGHDKALVAAKEKSEELVKLATEYENKSKELIDTKDLNDKEIRKKDAMIQELKEEKGIVAAAPGGEEKVAARPPEEIHALALDVSRGTTLWDKARGKILRMDNTGRRPYLNIGSAHGLRPGITFNVFAAGPDSKAKGLLKGTLEVVSVQGNTSQAQVTTLYDLEGREIPLADASRSQLYRETENPLREGDLLFNLAWKEHVAIAGPVGLAPGTEESPAEQARDLQRYIHAMETKGVVVDAYVNLLDGRVIGAITPETGFLVQGYLPASKEEREGKDDRAKAVRAGMETLRKQALEQGTFVISPENLAVVMGARQLRANLRSETQSTFRPRLPEGRTPPPEGVPVPLRKGDEKTPPNP